MDVLIYQMGKVGSTSLEKSIPGSIHLHSLYGNYPCPEFERFVHGDIKLLVKKSVVLPCRRNLYKLRGRKKIISLVREPVARNISMFFQDLPFWIANYVKHHDRETRESDLAWLWQVFQKSFNHDYCLQWFDKEIRRFTGIDVMKEAFDTRQGYQLYQRNGFELLLLKMEDLHKNKAIIEEFCNLEIELISANKGEEKWYGEVYKNFLKSYKGEVQEKYSYKYQLFREQFGYV